MSLASNSRSTSISGGWKAVAALLTVCAALGLEVFARTLLPDAEVWDQQLRSTDPDLCFELRPATRVTYRLPGFFAPWTVEVNRSGYLGPELGALPQDGQARWVMLGPGPVSGSGTGTEGALPARLQQALIRQGVAVEVANLGVMGYKTQQSVARLDRLLAKLAPQVVLLASTEGDLDPPECGVFDLPAWARSRSAALTLLGWWWSDRQRWQAGSAYRQSIGLRSEAAALDRLARLAQAHRFAVVILLFSKEQVLHSQREALYRAHGWPVIDLEPALGGPRKPPLFASSLGNLSAAGNDRLVARLIPQLNALGILRTAAPASNPGSP